MADEDGFTLLKQEMENEEINIKVNAIHRLKTVILSISESATIDAIIPYIESKSALLSQVRVLISNFQ